MAAGIAWAAMAFAIVRRWASATGWTGLHRWCIASTAALVCMVAGFLGSSWPKIDLIGKAIMSVIAVMLLILLARKIARNDLQEGYDLRRWLITEPSPLVG